MILRNIRGRFPGIILAALIASALTGYNGIAYAETIVADTPLAAGQKTPVESHGALKVSGNRIVGKAGEPVQLKGMSLFWSQWGAKFYTKDAIGYTSTYWNASVVRAAMGVENGGYLTNKAAEKAKIAAVVSTAKGLGIYVIIDWHDHHAESHVADAVAFFTEAANTYKDTPNVIFEIYNEPLNTVSWNTVKAYSLKVIKAIRDTGAENLIVVGSPSWDQNINDAADSPITGFTNIAYSLHFYAGTHTQWLRDRADAALKRGIALFATEWGTCDASGNGNFSPAESDAWISWMDANKISWCNWSLFDKDETASALKPNARTSGGWTSANLTQSGLYIKDKLRAGGVFE